MNPPGQRDAPGGQSEGAREVTTSVLTLDPAADRTALSRECAWCGASTGSWLAICRRCTVDLRKGTARRRDAALQLPPLACGHRDPMGAQSDAPQALGAAR
jgi:hypothetical protein